MIGLSLEVPMIPIKKVSILLYLYCYAVFGPARKKIFLYFILTVLITKKQRMIISIELLLNWLLKILKQKLHDYS